MQQSMQKRNKAQVKDIANTNLSLMHQKNMMAAQMKNLDKEKDYIAAKKDEQLAIKMKNEQKEAEKRKK